MSREHQLGIVIGRKGCGKTYETLNKQIKETLNGNYGKKKPQKVLIMDSNNEYGDVRGDHKNDTFPIIRAIAADHVADWTKNGVVEARRVSIMKPIDQRTGLGGGKMNLEEYRYALNIILDSFRNGLLLLEDLTRYVTDSMPGDLLGSIISQRHVAVDTIIHFQTVGKMAHPQLFGNANWIRVHKTGDRMRKKAENLEDHLEPLSILEELVDINYKGKKVPENKRFYGYYNKDTNKITGKLFNKQMFRMGIESYLEKNMKVVKDEINRESLYEGEKIYKTRKEAIEHLIDHYMTEYYGNPDYTPLPKSPKPIRVNNL